MTIEMKFQKFFFTLLCISCLIATCQCQGNKNKNKDKLLSKEDFMGDSIDRNLKEYGSSHAGISNEKDECQNDKKFHPAGIFLEVEQVNHKADCIQLCRKDTKCHSTVYVDSKKCQLFKNSRDKNDLPLTGLSTAYCSVADVAKLKGEDKKEVLKSGKASGQCGKPHFPPNWTPAAVPIGRRKRIIGDETNPYTAPWMVQIMAKKPQAGPSSDQSDQQDKPDNFLCAGSLIPNSAGAKSSCYVLTSADCVLSSETHLKYTRNDLYIISGSFDLRFTEAHEQKSEIEHVYVSRKEQPRTRHGFLESNLAILKTKNCFDFNFYVDDLCLAEDLFKKPSTAGPTPLGPSTGARPRPNTGSRPGPSTNPGAGSSYGVGGTAQVGICRSCYTVGWGMSNSGVAPKKNYHDLKEYRLKQANVKIIVVRDRFLTQIHEESLTIKRPEEFDVGSPIVCQVNDSKKVVYEITGVISKRSFDKSELDFQSMDTHFLSVSNFRQWIDSILTTPPAGNDQSTLVF